MDREQVKVIQLLVDTGVKLLLAIVAALILIACTITLIVKPSWPIAIAEMLFGGTVFVVYKHYFPSSTESPTRDPDSRT